MASKKDVKNQTERERILLKREALKHIQEMLKGKNGQNMRTIHVREMG